MGKSKWYSWIFERGGVMSRKYLTIKNAKKVFKSKGISGKPTNTVAVDNISLDIFKG